MSQNPISILEERWNWLPPLLDSSPQDLIRIGNMVPHGDRRYRAQSCRAKHQDATTPWNDCVVREFVLNDHVGDHRRTDGTGRLAAPPANHVRQGFERGELNLQSLHLCPLQPNSVPNGHGSEAGDA